jgi:mannose-6-phosphate isomerase-like protein (cupin superfamily)
VITKKDILFSKNNQKVFFVKGFISSILNWQDAFDLFKIANSKGGVNFNSFGTCTIDQSEQYTSIYKDLVKKIYTLHPGQKISALSIIHFITKHNNVVNNDVFNNFKDYFINYNPNKIPNIMPPIESFNPTRHSDPVDGFFIQFEGSTLWTIYYENNEEQYNLKYGDMMFIPKNLEHSVESLEPRCSVSISFTDGQVSI